MNVKDLYPDYLDELPEEYHDVFLELVGNGSNPKAVAAAIEYVDTPKSQEQAADEWETTTVSVRNNYPAVLSLTDTEMEETKWKGVTVEDLAERVISELGWEEDEHYSTVTAYTGDSPSYNLKKPGWASLAEVLDEDD